MEQDKDENLPIGWQYARTISLERSTKQENLEVWFNGSWEELHWNIAQMVGTK